MFPVHRFLFLYLDSPRDEEVAAVHTSVPPGIMQVVFLFS